MLAAAAAPADGSGPQAAPPELDRSVSAEQLLACLQSCGGQLSSVSQPGDAHCVLEQRRNELAIAEELGQALLNKSARLARHGERIRLQYSSEAKALQLDNSKLRHRLAIAEEEVSAARKEHEVAAADLTRRLAQQQEATALTQRETLLSSEQLRQQNDRLSAELQAICAKEPRLKKEAATLHDEVAQKRKTAGELTSRLDELSDQNKLLRSKQSSLETSCRQATEEFSDLELLCAQLQQKAAWLERKNFSLSDQVTAAAHQLAKMQEHVTALESELENRALAVDNEVPSSYAKGHSLLEELEISQRSITSGYESTQSIDDELDKDDGCSQVSPTLPLDAYGKLQLEVFDTIEVLGQAAASMAAFLADSENRPKEEPRCTAALADDSSPGSQLLSIACQSKRLAREIVADAADCVYSKGTECQAGDSAKVEHELTATVDDLRKEIQELAEAAARDEERAERLRQERTEAEAMCDEAFRELLCVKGELMGRENELLETTQARLRLARQRDLWMADMAEVVRIRIEAQLRSEAAGSRPAKTAGRGAL